MYAEYNTLRRTPGLVTWLLWVVLTSTGGSLGTIITILNPNSTSFLNQLFIWFFLVSPLFFVALGQWLLLRCFIAQSGWWLLTGGLGFLFVVPYLLFYGFSFESLGYRSLTFGTQEFWSVTLSLTIMSLIFGSIVGLVQGGLLIWRFGKRPRRLAWWVVGSAIAWGVGYPVSEQFLPSLFWHGSTPTPPNVSWLLALQWLAVGTPWGIIGAITGAVLIWLGRATVPDR